MTDRNRAVFVISVAAELAGVHPQTLRIYERKGLLDPARTIGGSRRYSERDIARLRRINDLTAAGLNLAGVKQVMGYTPTYFPGTTRVADGRRVAVHRGPALVRRPRCRRPRGPQLRNAELERTGSVVSPAQHAR